MNKNNFQYFSLNGFLEINSLSPNNMFYYKISSIDELSMAWWTCRIAFYDSNNNLLYYRSDIHTAWLSPYDKLIFMKWSNDGNYALIFEYKRDIINDFVLLDLIDKYSYRINSKICNCKFLEAVNNKDFDGVQIMNEIILLNGIKQSFVQNSVYKYLRKWYPINAKL
ncbi:MAG: hypothetical protein A2491_07030 [Bacteroidetes bacterium RIFOXYC12_FULL_35_7]|nr:MAG: hypothetical protein A2491_07030 [Bacteroidetes bacterium RIFOXYC12_FULL_35_7]